MDLILEYGFFVCLFYPIFLLFASGLSAWWVWTERNVPAIVTTLVFFLCVELPRILIPLECRSRITRFHWV